MRDSVDSNVLRRLLADLNIRTLPKRPTEELGPFNNGKDGHVTDEEVTSVARSGVDAVGVETSFSSEGSQLSQLSSSFLPSSSVGTRACAGHDEEREIIQTNQKELHLTTSGDMSDSDGSAIVIDLVASSESESEDMDADTVGAWKQNNTVQSWRRDLDDSMTPKLKLYASVSEEDEESLEEFQVAPSVTKGIAGRRQFLIASDSEEEQEDQVKLLPDDGQEKLNITASPMTTRNQLWPISKELKSDRPSQTSPTILPFFRSIMNGGEKKLTSEKENCLNGGQDPPRRPLFQPPRSTIDEMIRTPITKSSKTGFSAFLDTTSSPAKKSCSAKASSFTKIRSELAAKLYAQYNDLVFDSKLPKDMDISWNKRLATTAGVTHYKRTHAPSSLSSNGLPDLLYSARIELSCKVIDDEEKLERTLVHEMCHVAAWLIDHVAKPPHGPAFKAWASRAMRAAPHLDVSTCHQYEIHFPYRWQCSGCHQMYQRHSNSIDINKKVCGQCRGKLLYLGKFTRDGELVPSRKPTAFSLFVKENFAKVKKEHPSNLPASAVMKILSQKWANSQKRIVISKADNEVLTRNQEKTASATTTVSSTKIPESHSGFETSASNELISLIDKLKF